MNTTKILYNAPVASSPTVPPELQTLFTALQMKPFMELDISRHIESVRRIGLYSSHIAPENFPHRDIQTELVRFVVLTPNTGYFDFDAACSTEYINLYIQLMITRFNHMKETLSEKYEHFARLIPNFQKPNPVLGIAIYYTTQIMEVQYFAD